MIGAIASALLGWVLRGSSTTELTLLDEDTTALALFPGTTF